MTHDVGILFDAAFERHDTGPGHPERPLRLGAIGAGLRSAGLLGAALLLSPKSVADDVLHRIHAPEYVRRVGEHCRARKRFIDVPDSAICADSDEIARLAAGGVVEAARRIGRGELQRAFCAVRPPGHHAERDRSMGFCLYNNIALAATVFRDEFALQRIAIVDFDVHHGNGTQHMFESDARVLFVSTHGHPRFLYPGTGHEHETGVGAGAGFTMNITFMPDEGDAAHRSAMEERVLPALRAYQPQVLLLSAGFDAHADDPLGCMALSDEHFGWMTGALLEATADSTGGRVLSVLEGGYNLDVLRRCVPAHVRQLIEHR
ncbi:MAG: histone deacetylase [Planctomycetia bacterium]|nr:MAG: histone deacetylase [Planctomycetia bacterium]